MIYVRDFGEISNGQRAQLFILDNGNASVYITDLGARIVAINVPDKNNILTDIVLGVDNAQSYEDGIIGIYRKTALNNKIFDAYVDGDTLKMSFLSSDADKCLPENLKLEVIFYLTNDNTLSIEYYVVGDKNIDVDFNNQIYFNLNGAITEKTVCNHTLKINAEFYLKNYGNDIVKIPVEKTGMDFRTPVDLAETLNSEYADIKSAAGIDHNFVLCAANEDNKSSAELYCADTGIFLECFTDSPTINIYTGNHIDYNGGKGYSHYGRYSAVCIEPQIFINESSSDNHLKSGQEFYCKTVYRFSVK